MIQSKLEVCQLEDNSIRVNLHSWYTDESIDILETVWEGYISRWRSDWDKCLSQLANRVKVRTIWQKTFDVLSFLSLLELQWTNSGVYRETYLFAFSGDMGFCHKIADKLHWQTERIAVRTNCHCGFAQPTSVGRRICAKPFAISA